MVESGVVACLGEHGEMALVGCVASVRGKPWWWIVALVEGVAQVGFMTSGARGVMAQVGDIAWMVGYGPGGGHEIADRCTHE